MAGDGTDYFDVRAKLQQLEKDFDKAADIYIEHVAWPLHSLCWLRALTCVISMAHMQGQVEEAMAMYEELHRFDMSIQIAERCHHPEAATLRENYYGWLLETKQEEKAGGFAVFAVPPSHKLLWRSARVDSDL